MQKITVNKFIVWDFETIQATKDKAEEESWQDMKDGKINSIQYTNQILAIRKWAREQLDNLCN